MKDIPAFPRPSTPRTFGQGGMTLRDYFAGQALIGLVSIDFNEKSSLCEKLGVDGKTWGEIAAQQCYGYADALLKQRKKESNNETTNKY